MNLITLTRLLAMVLAFIGAVGSTPAAMAQTSELDLTRTALDDAAAELSAIRDQIEAVEDMLDAERFYWAPVPVIGAGSDFAVVDRDTALRYWTLQYIITRDPKTNPFSAREMVTWINEMLANGRTIKRDLEATLAQLQQLERAAMARRATLEQKVSDLQGPQRTGRCVDLQRVEATGALGELAYVNRGALEHYVNQSGDTGRGWIGSFALTWTAPPDRICVGKSFSVTLTATNNAPVDDTLLARAAEVSMGLKPGMLAASCSNPPPFDPDSAAFVSPNQPIYTNVCDITVDSVGDGRLPQDLIDLSLTAIPAIGTLVYIYQ